MPLHSPLWIFGYGSLLWKQSHPSTETRLCFVKDYARRLWQGSPDHRGTPQRPGRVATLIASPGDRCWGIAQCIPSEDIDATLHALDIREQAGYERLSFPLYDSDGKTGAEGISYAAAESNPHYLGPDSTETVASYVLTCQGPSGSNVEYVLNLAAALRKMGVEDPHVESIADAIEKADSGGMHD